MKNWSYYNYSSIESFSLDSVVRGMAHFMTHPASRVEQMTVLVNKSNQIPFPAVPLTTLRHSAVAIHLSAGVV